MKMAAKVLDIANFVDQPTLFDRYKRQERSRKPTMLFLFRKVFENLPCVPSCHIHRPLIPTFAYIGARPATRGGWDFGCGHFPNSRLKDAH